MQLVFFKLMERFLKGLKVLRDKQGSVTLILFRVFSISYRTLIRQMFIDFPTPLWGFFSTFLSQLN